MSIFDWWTQRKLQSDDPEKRKKALVQLVKSGTYDPLMDVLKNPAVRDEAISEFSKMGQPAEDFLRAASNHGDKAVKAAAALALGQMGNSLARDLLANLVRDRSAAVQDRIAAVRLLSESSNAPAVIATLQTALDDDGDLRTEAALALGRMLEPVAVEPLIDLVADRQVNQKVRSQAAFLLSKLGDPRSVETL